MFAPATPRALAVGRPSSHPKIGDSLSTAEQATAANQRARTALRAMMTARWIDAVEEELVQRGEAFFQLGGAGHEASAVLADHLGPQDWLQPHYRSRALLIARGFTPDRFFHGLLSTAESDSAGRQMPAFLHHPELHVMPMTVPTGDGLLHAVGVAREVAHEGVRVNAVRPEIGRAHV